MTEIYSAIGSNNNRLALMGARSLIDHFLSLKVNSQESFSKRMEKAVEFGFIGKRQSNIILPALEAGHAAVHRGHLPSGEDLEIVLDIVESLIQWITLEDRALELDARTPRRPSKRS